VFGLDNYDAAFDEKLDLLLRLREQGRIARWQGRFRPPLQEVDVIPRAIDLPVWVGVGGSPGSLERAGRLGLPMTLGLIGGSIDHARRAVDAYRAAGEAAGHADRLRVAISIRSSIAPSASRHTMKRSAVVVTGVRRSGAGRVTVPAGACREKPRRCVLGRLHSASACSDQGYWVAPSPALGVNCTSN